MWPPEAGPARRSGALSPSPALQQPGSAELLPQGQRGRRTHVTATARSPPAPCPTAGGDAGAQLPRTPTAAANLRPACTPASSASLPPGRACSGGSLPRCQTLLAGARWSAPVKASSLRLESQLAGPPSPLKRGALAAPPNAAAARSGRPAAHTASASRPATRGQACRCAAGGGSTGLAGAECGSGSETLGDSRTGAVGSSALQPACNRTEAGQPRLWGSGGGWMPARSGSAASSADPDGGAGPGAGVNPAGYWELCGVVQYFNRYLIGDHALWRAFPQFLRARGDHKSARRPVQLHLRQPDGTLRPYDVMFCVSGQGSCSIQRTMNLARDFGLSNMDMVSLFRLPDGRVEVVAMGAVTSTLCGLVQYSNRYLIGGRALRRAFPQFLRAKGDESRALEHVQLHLRDKDGNLRPYSVMFCVFGQGSCRIQHTMDLARDLRLSNKDVVFLFRLPDGRVEVAPVAAVVSSLENALAPRKAMLGGGSGSGGRGGLGALGGGGGAAASPEEQGQGSSDIGEALGTLVHAYHSLIGKHTLLRAFSDLVPPGHGDGAAGSGAGCTWDVQLYARKPDGQLGMYDVSLRAFFTSGGIHYRIQRIRLLVRELALSEGAEVELRWLPGGRVLLAATGRSAAQVARPRLATNTSTVRRGIGGTYLYVNWETLHRCFPQQAEAALLGGQAPQPVQVYARLPGGELHPYILTVGRMRQYGFFLGGSGPLLGDLGLRDGDTLQLCVQPDDGRVVLEPTHPRPGFDPNAIALTRSAILNGHLVVPLRIVARLLGEQEAVLGAHFPVCLEPGEGKLGHLKKYFLGFGAVRWRLAGLRPWLSSLDAAPGDTVVLSAEAAAAGAAAPQEPHEALLPTFVAKLVRSGTQQLT